jgi:hypothetical protein
MLLLEPDSLRFPALDGEAEAWIKGRGIGQALQLLRPFRGLLVQALLLNLTIGVLALGMPLVMQILTDDVLVRGDSSLLRSLAIGILALFMLRSLLGLLQGVLVGHFGQKLQLQMVLHYGQHLLRLPLTYFESRRSGELRMLSPCLCSSCRPLWPGTRGKRNASSPRLCNSYHCGAWTPRSTYYPLFRACQRNRTWACN